MGQTENMESRRLDEVGERFQGDWFACASFVEQLATVIRPGQLTSVLSIRDIRQDELGRPLLIPGSSDTDLANRPPDLLADGAVITTADHVYSLGAILYTLLCGRPPHTSSNSAELARQIREDLPQPPRQLVHGIPQCIEDVCLKSLAKKRSDRFSSIEEFAGILRQAIRSAEDSVTADSLSTLRVSLTEDRSDSRYVAILRLQSEDGEALDSNQLLPVQAAITNAASVRVTVFEDGFLVDSSVSSSDSPSDLLRELLTCLRSIQTVPVSCRVTIRLATTPLPNPQHSADSDFELMSLQIQARVSQNAIALTDQSVAALRRWLPDNELPEWNQYSQSERTFLGRSAQMGIVESRWSQCLEGMGQVVLVVGGGGAGKTRFVNEFVARLANREPAPTRIEAACRPVIQGVSFYAVAESLSTAASNGDVALQYFSAAANELCKRIVTTESKVLSPEEKQSLEEGLLDGLRQAAVRNPIVLTIDDIQWADSATLDLLQKLVTDGPNHRMLTIATCRSDFETPWGSHPNQSQISLPSLTRKYIAEMLSGQSGDGPGDAFVRRAKKISQGIPSLVEAVHDGILKIPNAETEA